MTPSQVRRELQRSGLTVAIVDRERSKSWQYATLRVLGEKVEVRAPGDKSWHSFDLQCTDTAHGRQARLFTRFTLRYAGWGWLIGEENLTRSEARGYRERFTFFVPTHCRECGELLTTPDSITREKGPTCGGVEDRRREKRERKSRAANDFIANMLKRKGL